MKKCLILFMMIMISSVALWAEYTGDGAFEKINGIADLESDTYYVFYGINCGSKGAMTNTISSGRLGNTAVTVTANKIVDPLPAIVWFVTENPAGEYTIYNEAEGKYAELTGSSTAAFELNTTSSHTYEVSDNNAKGLFFKSNHASAASKGISIYERDWRTYVKTGANTLELYKLNDSGEPIPLNANFTTDFVTGIMPLTINFESTVIGGTESYSYAWDFNNDGTTDSTLENPSHIYTTDGTYSVKLTVTDGENEVTELKTDFIIVLAGAPAGELVTNGDLELWDGNSPTGWIKKDNIVQESTIVHGGSYSAKQTSAKKTKTFNQDVSGIVPGETYTISYWYLDNDLNAKTRIYSYWLVGTTTNTTHVTELRPDDYSADSPVWQHVSHDLVAPAGVNGFRFEVRAYNEGVGGGVVYYDDFSVKLYDPSTPTPPTITNVVQTPNTDITSSTTVSVSATVTPGSSTVEGVEVYWGITANSLLNHINMTVSEDNVYTTDSDILAQEDGTTVYYHVYVMDGNSDETTSLDYSYIVTDPVIEPLTVDFEANATTVYVDQKVAFTSTTTGGVEPYLSYDWTFGDTTESEEASPTHTYTEEGTYTVALMVGDSGEGLEVVEKVDYITVLPALPPSVDPAVGTLYISEVNGTKDIQYIELYNNSAEVLSLEKVILKMYLTAEATSSEKEFSLNNSAYTGDISILPHNYIIITRNKSKATVETEIGYSLPVSVAFLQGDADMYFGAKGSRRWQLVLDTEARAEIVIDDTNALVGGLDKINYQSSPGVWDTSTESTPGAPHLDQTLPVTLSSFMAVQTSENFAKITWTTESESSLTGYNVFRNVVKDQDTATRVNSSLIVAENSSQGSSYSYVDDQVVVNTTYYYWLQINEFDGSASFHGPYRIRIEENNNQSVVIPLKTTLRSVYPNPFNPTTSVSFYMEHAENIKINIYNIKGQLITNLIHDSFAKGFHNVMWNGKDTNGSDCASGVYFFRMETRSDVQTIKGILMK